MLHYIHGIQLRFLKLYKGNTHYFTRESAFAVSCLTQLFKLRRQLTRTHIRLISFHSILLYDLVKVPMGIIRISLALMEHISDRN